LDDLFVAVVRRRTEQSLEWMAEALRKTDQPLWAYASDKTGERRTHHW
jgi:protein tyrosine phosphatase (PTP) superfamily phosphohydrolase (DUF442 family)